MTFVGATAWAGHERRRSPPCRSYHYLHNRPPGRTPAGLVTGSSSPTLLREDREIVYMQTPALVRAHVALHAWLRTGTQVRTEPERRHPGGVEVGNTSVHACELHRTTRAHKRTCMPGNEHVPDATPERSCSYTTKWAYTKTTAAGWGRAITYAWVQVRPRAGRACQRVRRTPDRQVPMNTYPHAYTSGTAWWSLALRQTGQGTAANTHPCVHDDPAERHQDDETASRGRPRMAITTRSNRDDGFEASCPTIRLDCGRSRTSRSESKPRGCPEGATISRRRDLQHPCWADRRRADPARPWVG